MKYARSRELSLHIRAYSFIVFKLLVLISDLFVELLNIYVLMNISKCLSTYIKFMNVLYFLVVL